MPICMIIALDIVMTLRGSINCSTVICSPTVIFAILREASSEHYGPRVYFTSYFQLYRQQSNGSTNKIIIISIREVTKFGVFIHGDFTKQASTQANKEQARKRANEKGERKRQIGEVGERKTRGNWQTK